MGFTSWTFQWDGTGWRRRPVKWMDRVWNGTERLPGGGHLLTAMIVVELEDRIPVAAYRPEYARWPIGEDGTLDQRQVRELAALVMPIFDMPSPGNVIQAEGRFGQRRYQAEAKWEPTAEQKALLAEALVKAGLGAALVEHLTT